MVISPPSARARRAARIIGEAQRYIQPIDSAWQRAIRDKLDSMQAWQSRVTVIWALGLVSAACAHAASSSQVPPTAAVRSAPQAAPRYASPYTYEWFIRAELLRGRGQLDAAIEAYRAALAGADEDAYVSARLATALDERGEHGAAKELLDAALEREPDSEAVWLARAELAGRAGDSAAALEALERAEQAQPLSPRAPQALAARLRAQGSPERADAVLLRYEARSLPGTRAAQAVRLRRALASQDPDRVFAATLPYRTGAPPEAAELSEAARLLLERGRAQQAWRVIALVPETAHEPGLRLRVLSACARFAEAEAWLAIHEPSDSQERRTAARVYLAVGRPELAERMVELESSLASSRDDGSLASAHADGSLARDPGLQLLTAQIALARATYAQAAQLFAEVPAGSSAHAEALIGLAVALRAQGMPELAAEVSARTAQ
jgi:tetratricopeptide (TPR) repeat protein